MCGFRKAWFVSYCLLKKEYWLETITIQSIVNISIAFILELNLS